MPCYSQKGNTFHLCTFNAYVYVGSVCGKLTIIQTLNFFFNTSMICITWNNHKQHATVNKGTHSFKLFQEYARVPERGQVLNYVLRGRSSIRLVPLDDGSCNPRRLSSYRYFNNHIWYFSTLFGATTTSNKNNRNISNLYIFYFIIINPTSLLF